MQTSIQEAMTCASPGFDFVCALGAVLTIGALVGKARSKAYYFFTGGNLLVLSALTYTMGAVGCGHVQGVAASGASVRVGGCAANAPRSHAPGRSVAVTELRDVLRGPAPPLFDRCETASETGLPKRGG